MIVTIRLRSRKHFHDYEAMVMSKRAYTDSEAAEYIGMSETFLRQSRIEGDRPNRTPGPPWVKIGRSVRYLKEDLDAWLEAHRIDRKAG